MADNTPAPSDPPHSDSGAAVNTKPKRRYDKFYLIACLLLTAAASGLLLRWHIKCEVIRSDFWVFLPALYFSGAYVNTRFKFTDTGPITLIIVGILITAVAILFALAYDRLGLSLREVTNPARYQQSVQEYAHVIGHEHVPHFPIHIPDHATLVRFAYQRRFLMGGALLQLRLNLPKDEITTLLATYSSNGMSLAALKERLFPDSPSKKEEEYYGAPRLEIPFRTGDSNKGRVLLPEDYQIFYLEPILNAYDFHGVAISEKRCEIIYWAQTSED